jgi:hypothetical protein
MRAARDGVARADGRRRAALRFVGVTWTGAIRTESRARQFDPAHAGGEGERVLDHHRRPLPFRAATGVC